MTDILLTIEKKSIDKNKEEYSKNNILPCFYLLILYIPREGICMDTNPSDYSLMLGSSSPMPFFLSTIFRMKPMMRAATPRPASMMSGAV